MNTVLCQSLRNTLKLFILVVSLLTPKGPDNKFQIYEKIKINARQITLKSVRSLTRSLFNLPISALMLHTHRQGFYPNVIPNAYHPQTYRPQQSPNQFFRPQHFTISKNNLLQFSPCLYLNVIPKSAPSASK